ncbi:MAG: hypothetical protein LJE69_20595 [Thiohalocapsa sp.]|jgi:hypothetical protein|uniref:hypothetical protein n=1 Tax=Thiohalocapsa sp. TaxID=2497641 RepID=UPI0025E99BC8|nr:hypothetical protein [Thiohalocapsa sp.]MCG6943637.1 hypothetical protein [Thiohalocapsa sp.]
MTASYLAAREAARKAARTGIDVELERLIAQFARDDMRAGRDLSVESRARVRLALDRLRAAAHEGQQHAG